MAIRIPIIAAVLVIAAPAFAGPKAIITHIAVGCPEIADAREAEKMRIIRGMEGALKWGESRNCKLIERGELAILDEGNLDPPGICVRLPERVDDNGRCLWIPPGRTKSYEW